MLICLGGYASSSSRRLASSVQMQVQMIRIWTHLFHDVRKLFHAHLTRMCRTRSAKGARQVAGIADLHIDTFEFHSITNVILPHSPHQRNSLANSLIAMTLAESPTTTSQLMRSSETVCSSCWASGSVQTRICRAIPNTNVSSNQRFAIR